MKRISAILILTIMFAIIPGSGTAAFTENDAERTEVYFVSAGWYGGGYEAKVRADLPEGETAVIILTCKGENYGNNGLYAMSMKKIDESGEYTVSVDMDGPLDILRMMVWRDLETMEPVSVKRNVVCEYEPAYIDDILVNGFTVDEDLFDGTGRTRYTAGVEHDADSVHIRCVNYDGKFRNIEFFYGNGVPAAGYGNSDEYWVELHNKDAEEIMVIVKGEYDNDNEIYGTRYYVDIVRQTPPDGACGGIKLDKNGMLIPGDPERIKTFETGKAPDPDKVYYVSIETGSDTNDGSYESPFKTVDKARPLLVPGSALYIMPGEYPRVYWDNSSPICDSLNGTEEEPIWIGGIPGGERPKIFTFHLMKVSYIIFHDMEVSTQGGAGEANMYGMHVHDNGYPNHRCPGGDCDFSDGKGTHVYDDAGVLTHWTDTHHLVFRNIYSHFNGSNSFKLSGTAYTWVYDCQMGDNVSAAGIGINYVGGHHSVNAYNYLHDIKGYGYQYKGGCYSNTAYGNLFVRIGSSGGAAINMGQATGVEMFYPPNNVVSAGGVWVADPEKENRGNYEGRDIKAYSNVFVDCNSPVNFNSSGNCYFVNNTVINPVTFLFRILNMDYGDAMLLANKSRAHDGVIANNIYHVDGERYYGNAGLNNDLDTFVITNNLFYKIDSPGSRPFLDGGMEQINTLYVNPYIRDITGDFKLESRSPAVGGGIRFGFADTDYECKPFRDVPSIGAVQY